MIPVNETTIGSIKNKVLLNHKDIIKILGILEPRRLDENSTLYHIGYERAKQEVLEVVLGAIHPEWKASTAVQIIRELRRSLNERS